MTDGERGRPVVHVLLADGTIPALGQVDSARGHAVAETYLTAHADGGWLDSRICAELLACYCIPQLPWAWAETEADAVLAAERLRGADGRVVLKAHWPGLLHKSEQRAVHLDLQSDAQVRASFRDFETRFAGLMRGVVVSRSPRAVPSCSRVSCRTRSSARSCSSGSGGTATRVLADHAARLAPLTDHDVHDLITAPRSLPCCSARTRANRSTSKGSNSCSCGCPGWRATRHSLPKRTSIPSSLHLAR
ncbi:hypothetical protein GCM10010350_75910 [Streptomyces galilaeus]|nr:acetate--CoA ligase family protein [Streptomyces galilaeus]GGW79859.1 hypothetical protein GCM10010350_75910 [Streptomyces galilaeus]